MFRPVWRVVSRPRFVGTVAGPPPPGPVVAAFHDGTSTVAATVAVDFGVPPGPPGPHPVSIEFIS